MERYRLGWLQSTSAFADTQDVLAKLNGGAEQVLETGLSMTVNQVDVDFEQDAAVEFWIRTKGDNGTQADSEHSTFTAANEEQVAPATDLTHQFVAHLP